MKPTQIAAALLATSTLARGQLDTHPQVVVPTLRFADFDRDGLADVYVVRPERGDRLLRNLGDGSFVDVTESMGLAGSDGSRLALWQDFDLDGWLDLYVGGAHGGRLLRNESGAGFVDASVVAGVESDGAVLFAEWFDYDLDGWSVLHVITERGERLLRNVGGRFRAAGLPSTGEPDGAPIRLPPSLSSSSLASSSPGEASGAGTGGPLALGNRCPQQLKDAATGNCLSASTTPTLGALFPLSTNLNVNASGNIGVGTTSPAQKLDVVGNVRASGQFVSTSAGAPLVVASSTKVVNLNADKLDGLDSSAFSQLGASIESGEITDATILDADVNASAAIAGTKVAPNFGAQNVVSTGAIDVLGLRTLATTTAPNVIAGIAGNAALDGAEGGTISGGGTVQGPNQVTDDHGTVGGGRFNVAGNANASHTDAPYATVGGGSSNTAGYYGATVGGGAINDASYWYTTVGGGLGNSASGYAAVSPGGTSNDASGAYSFAAGNNAQAGGGCFVWQGTTLNYPPLFGSTGSEQFLVKADGGVGLGTNAPEAQLHVFTGSAGTITASTSSSAVFERDVDNYISVLAPDNSESGILFGSPSAQNGASLAYNAGTTSELRIRMAGSTKVTVLPTGNVGIGTVAPAFLLHVNGSAGKPGGGSWSVPSDARLKKNVRTLSGSLDMLLRLRGVSFEYIDPKSIGELAGERTGFIAQEVEQVLPDWVETGPDGFKKLTIRGFEALAVEALRELRAEKDGEIAGLREQLASTESLLAAQNDALARMSQRLDEIAQAVASR
jgi:hypothetical protein